MDKTLNIKEIRITPEMLNLIAEMDEFKGAWKEMRSLPSARLSSLKKVATIESIGSSTRIEGAKLSDQEVGELLSSVQEGSFQSRDEEEVASYSFACERILEHYADIPLTENAIQEMHAWVLNYSSKDTYHRGSYKKTPIRIEAFDREGKSQGILFETTSPMETPIQMESLIRWTKEQLENKELHPLIVIGLFVVLFLAIHPFQDGNGRLSRLLTTWLMLRSGYLFVNYSSLESVIEANKESYYQALQKTQTLWQKDQADWTLWLEFFLRSLQRQKKHLEIKIAREKAIRKQPGLAQKVMDYLSTQGELRLSDLVVLTQANRHTLKKALATLVQEGSIRKLGKGKSSYYAIF